MTIYDKKNLPNQKEKIPDLIAASGLTCSRPFQQSTKTDIVEIAVTKTILPV